MKKATVLGVFAPRTASQTIHQWVYQVLCDAIFVGTFVPGVSLTLRGIAENLGTSPMPVREAIRRLVAEGALEVLDNRRVCVCQMTQKRFDELAWARLTLEPELAARAAPHIDTRSIKRLRDIDDSLNQSLISGEVETYIDSNRRFHFGIFEKADSPILMTFVRGLWLQFAPFTRIVFGRVGTDYLQDYHQIALSALEANDHHAFKAAIKADIQEGLNMLAEHIQRKQKSHR